MTREQLYEDLHQAYLDARRHKRNKPYLLRFEANLERNIDSLCEDLLKRTYKPMPSECFVITDPKKREVFAAHFRDRIVHHLYLNSYCGLLSHWNNYNVRQMMLLKRHQFSRWGMFDYGLRHFHD